MSREKLQTGLVVTPLQLRAARELAQWSREDLAEHSGIAAVTIKSFEALGTESKRSTLLVWRKTLEGAGVEFIDDDGQKGPGVRLKRSQAAGRDKRNQ